MGIDMDKRQFLMQFANLFKDKEDITNEDIKNFLKMMLNEESNQNDLKDVYAEFLYGNVDAIENVISIKGKNGEEIISSELTSNYYNPAIGNIERRNLRLSKLDDGSVGEMVKKICDNNHKLSNSSPLYRCSNKNCRRILCDNCEIVRKGTGEIFCIEHTIKYKLNKSLWEL